MGVHVYIYTTNTEQSRNKSHGLLHDEESAGNGTVLKETK